MGGAGVAGARARTHVFEHLSYVPAGGGLGAASWRGRGQCPGHTVGDEPNTAAAPSGLLRLHGLGRGWKELSPSNIPHSRTLAKALTIPTQSSAPGPCARPARPPFLPPALGRRLKAAFSRFTLKDASKPKQSGCLIEKINYGKMWHLATMPLSQLCCPLPGLALLGSPHAHLVQLPPPDSGEGRHSLQGRGQPTQCQEQPEALPSRPSGAPAPAAPGETTEGELRLSQALCPSKENCGASSPGGAPHCHPKSQAQSVSCRGSSSCPPGHPRLLRAGSLRPVPSAASLSWGASRGSQDAGQGGGGRLGQRVQLGGLTLCRGWAARLRLRCLTVLPV